MDDLHPASRSELRQIAKLWQLENLDIISSSLARKDIKSYREDTETAILETISRRPCTVDDLSMILGLHINEVNKYMDVLEAEQKVQPVRKERGIFYRSG